LGSVSSLVSEKKIFEISVNQSILLALAAMLLILALKLSFVGKLIHKGAIYYITFVYKYSATS
jgi:hypothetical protein